MLSHPVLLFTLLGFALAGDPFSQPVHFDIRKVTEQAIRLPSHSWEYGTATEALLELYNPELSVFGERPFPAPKVDKTRVRALTYADEKIVIGTGRNALSDGDGAVGDPASLGVGAYLLGKSEDKYKKATEDQLNYVVSEAPRWENGAISHRADYSELWADFIYMAPPFIAYYGAATNNRHLLEEALEQCGKYREVLSSKSQHSNLWQHIIGPVNQDLGHWSTGNAWAAAGMTRVLATIQKAPIADIPLRIRAHAELTRYIKEIVDAVIAAPPDDDLVRNYVDDTQSAHGFGELAGTSLIASVIYRMAVLSPLEFSDHRYIPWANRVLDTLGGEDAQGKAHVTSEGIVRPTVNPLGWGDTTPFETGSPEAQNMVVIMYSAYRDYIKYKKW